MIAGHSRRNAPQRRVRPNRPTTTDRIELTEDEWHLSSCRGCGDGLPDVRQLRQPTIQLALEMQKEQRGYILQCAHCRCEYLVRRRWLAPTSLPECENEQADGPDESMRSSVRDLHS